MWHIRIQFHMHKLTILVLAAGSTEFRLGLCPLCFCAGLIVPSRPFIEQNLNKPRITRCIPGLPVQLDPGMPDQ